MNDKFVNLPTKYTNLLNESKKLFDANMLKKLSSRKISYDELNALHKNINIICSENECNSYDINKMINGYDKKNNVIDIFKSIANLRNKHIVSNAYKSDLWKTNLKNLKESSSGIVDKKINNDLVEGAFINLLKKYKYNWDGLWSIIELKNNNIKNINVFDPDDFEEFIKHLNV